MRFLFLRCGAPGVDLPAEAYDLSAVPSRKELSLIDAAATNLLPHDPTPSLDEIAAQPDVRHLGAPAAAPQELTWRIACALWLRARIRR